MRIQRHLAPTAAPVSWADIGRAIAGLICGGRYQAAVAEGMKRYFEVKHLYFLSSGKAAMTTIVRTLAAQSTRRKVIIPAYTCFSVPSAIVRAGCQVVLCDVDPHTLDFDVASLKELVDIQTLCIVCPHVLGQVADIQCVQAIAHPLGIFVVEDAAQAMGGRHQDRWLGMQGDVGLFSFGRGKNVTAGSGGVILTNSEELAPQLSLAVQDMPECSKIDQIANILTVSAMKLLMHPRSYWLPAGLPVLGLGETKFDREFPIHSLDGARAGLLKTWQQRLEQSNAVRAHRGQEYIDQSGHELEALSPRHHNGGAYLRVPVIMPTGKAKRALCALGAYEGLGLSSLYPTPISEIPELQPFLADGRFPGAQILADRMVTLPVHQYVRTSDISRVCMAIHALVNETLSEGTPLHQLSYGVPLPMSVQNNPTGVGRCP